MKSDEVVADGRFAHCGSRNKRYSWKLHVSDHFATNLIGKDSNDEDANTP